MAKMFGQNKPTIDLAMQKAQRRQAKRVQDQVADEARELGARNRLLSATRRGGSLFARTGGQGVKETLG